MLIVYLPERNDAVRLIFEGGRSIFGNIMNIDEDGAVLVQTTNGNNYIANPGSLVWDKIERMFNVRAKEVTI